MLPKNGTRTAKQRWSPDTIENIGRPYGIIFCQKSVPLWANQMTPLYTIPETNFTNTILAGKGSVFRFMAIRKKWRSTSYRKHHLCLIPKNNSLWTDPYCIKNPTWLFQEIRKYCQGRASATRWEQPCLPLAAAPRVSILYILCSSATSARRMKKLTTFLSSHSRDMYWTDVEIRKVAY